VGRARRVGDRLAGSAKAEEVLADPLKPKFELAPVVPDLLERLL
jgi:hypothetical protein